MGRSDIEFVDERVPPVEFEAVTERDRKITYGCTTIADTIHSPGTGR